MDSSTLRQVQLIQLEILKNVDRVCKEYGISYWLAGGTQLGAVRHNGFIPWDDDLDIAMLRKDYDRFCQIGQKALGERYFVQTWDTDKYFALPITKIRKLNTLFVEAGSKKSKLNQGIFIDIFPYDSWYEDEAKRSGASKQIYMYYRLLLLKNHYTPWLNGNHFDFKKWVFYIPLRIFSLFSSKETIKKRYYSIQIAENNNTNTEFVFGSGEPRNINHPMRRCVVENLCFHKFEDIEAPIPENYNEYLSLAYGDYMKLPPENERYNWHSVTEVNLGDKE